MPRDEAYQRQCQRMGCGKAVKVLHHRYCSDSCRMKDWRALNGRKALKCPHCGKSVRRRGRPVGR